MKKVDHDRIVKEMARRHTEEKARLQRLIDKLSADVEYLGNELDDLRTAFVAQAEELVEVMTHG